MTMTIQNILSGLKPVTPDCFSIFEPFYQARAKRYVYPRYNQSIFYMIWCGGNYFKVLNIADDRVLFVIRRSRFMGKFGLQVNLAPISLSGNTKIELEIIQLCYKNGISLKVDSYDIRRYRIPQKLCDRIDDNIEFVYDIAVGKAQEGAKFRKARNLTRKVMKTGGFTVSFDIPVGGDKIVHEWDYHYLKTHGQLPQQRALWNIIKAVHAKRCPQLSVQSILTDNGIEIISAIEHLSSRHHLFIFRVRNYDSPLNDANFAIQKINCESIGIGFANIGMGGEEGLDRQKESLIPCAKIQIYKMKSSTKLNKQLLEQYFK